MYKEISKESKLINIKRAYSSPQSQPNDKNSVVKIQEQI